MRVFLFVIDGFGIGGDKMASLFNDEGSNTYENVKNSVGLSLPFLEKLGLNNIDGINQQKRDFVHGSYARLEEKTFAKDTTAGHFEMAGIPLKTPYKTYPNGFPKELVEKISKESGYNFIANKVASGTKIINELGDEHLKSKSLILYTSQDSVMQIAGHTKVLSYTNLYKVCEIARKIMVGENSVGRVIARPFDGESGNYYRTDKRKDFSLPPPSGSMLEKLKENGYDVIGVGKIDDIFSNVGLTESNHTKDNNQSLNACDELLNKPFNGLAFINLIDTDMIYGHRNDVEGYKNALENIDFRLEKISKNISKDDVIIITGDHGCDPTTESTDHSRENVPLLIFGERIDKNKNLGIIKGFDFISKYVLELFNLK